jgi:hypothetical protein
MRKVKNIIIVNWKHDANPFPPGLNYLQASKNTILIGNQLATLITTLKIQASAVHCIGHSLGSHVCGFCGKNSTLGRISGLNLSL